MDGKDAHCTKGCPSPPPVLPENTQLEANFYPVPASLTFFLLRSRRDFSDGRPPGLLSYQEIFLWDTTLLPFKGKINRFRGKVQFKRMEQ